MNGRKGLGGVLLSVIVVERIERIIERIIDFFVINYYDELRLY